MAVETRSMTHPAGVPFPRYMRHRQRLNAIRERNKLTVAQVSKSNENSELARLLWRLEEQRCLRLAEWYNDLLNVRAELERIDHSKPVIVKQYTKLSNAEVRRLPIRIHVKPAPQIIASKEQLAQTNTQSFNDLVRRHTTLTLPPLRKSQRRHYKDLQEHGPRKK